jgi:Domain of unknown function (DUF4326)
MPPNTVYVGRPTKWGNPYALPAYSRRLAIDLYRNWLDGLVNRAALRPKELKGKNLACWCPLDQPCHADILLELANR